MIPILGAYHATFLLLAPKHTDETCYNSPTVSQSQVSKLKEVSTVKEAQLELVGYMRWVCFKNTS